jgi:hypothetical protein
MIPRCRASVDHKGYVNGHIINVTRGTGAKLPRTATALLAATTRHAYTLSRRKVEVNVAETIVTELVTSVLPILIVQADVFSEADSITSVITDVDDVAPTKTAVAVSKGTSIKNHAVPSLAIAQSPAAAVFAIG